MEFPNNGRLLPINNDRGNYQIVLVCEDHKRCLAFYCKTEGLSEQKLVYKEHIEAVAEISSINSMVYQVDINEFVIFLFEHMCLYSGREFMHIRLLDASDELGPGAIRLFSRRYGYFKLDAQSFGVCNKGNLFFLEWDGLHIYSCSLQRFVEDEIHDLIVYLLPIVYGGGLSVTAYASNNCQPEIAKPMIAIDYQFFHANLEIPESGDIKDLAVLDVHAVYNGKVLYDKSTEVNTFKDILMLLYGYLMKYVEDPTEKINKVLDW